MNKQNVNRFHLFLWFLLLLKDTGTCHPTKKSKKVQKVQKVQKKKKKKSPQEHVFSQELSSNNIYKLDRTS